MDILAFTRRAMLIAVATLAAPAGAALRPPTIDELRHMTPVQIRATMERVVQSQQASRTAGTLGGLDTTPPMLTKFSAAPTVDVTKPFASALVAYAATDDKSGVWSTFATARGPNGNFLYAGWVDIPPARNSAGTLVDPDLVTGFEEPGDYVFDSVYIYDAAGNVAIFDQAALEALGNVNVTVKNKLGFDNTPPNLVGGTIQTPYVSLSGHHPGTDQPRWAGITLEATDSGSPIPAGVLWASATFCLQPGTPCIFFSSWFMQPRQAASTITLGYQFNPDVDVPGEYRLYVVQFRDYANRDTLLLSTEFGGETDFSLYFPSTTIKVRP